MNTLVPLAAQVAARLKARGETVCVFESSTGGLIAAALVAVPGASSYFVAGGVIYTRVAQQALLQIAPESLRGVRASTEPYAVLAAETGRARLGTHWAIAETGATGPSGNSYGDPAGHSCIAVAGPVPCVITIETGSADRVANMRTFAARALELLIDCSKEHR